MKNITVELVKEGYNACYWHDGSQFSNIAEYANVNLPAKPSEVLDWTNIPAGDKFWLVFRKDLLGEDGFKDMCCKLVELCLGESEELDSLINESVSSFRLGNSGDCIQTVKAFIGSVKLKSKDWYVARAVLSLILGDGAMQTGAYVSKAVGGYQAHINMLKTHFISKGW